MGIHRMEDGEMLGLLKLSNDLHELPANPAVRHECMLKRLCEMTGASGGFSLLLDAPPREPARIVFLVHHGIGQAQAEWAINRYLRALHHPLSALLEFEAGHGERGCEWCEQCPLGAAMFSSTALPPSQLISILTLHRAANESHPFSEQQCRLVRLFHSQIGWTFRVSSATDPSQSMRLSPRQQQTLRHLLAGDSEKQIAQKIARSQHTVHTHIKAIYRHLGVSSRGELLSLFVK